MKNLSFILILFCFLISCEKENLLESQEQIPVDTSNPSLFQQLIPLQNPGFEEDEIYWGDPALFSISSNANTGEKSAKLSDPGDLVEQQIK